MCKKELFLLCCFVHYVSSFQEHLFTCERFVRFGIVYLFGRYLQNNQSISMDDV